MSRYKAGFINHGTVAILGQVHFFWRFPDGSVGKSPPAVQETQEMRVRFLGQEEPLEEEMTAHSSILA